MKEQAQKMKRGGNGSDGGRGKSRSVAERCGFKVQPVRGVYAINAACDAFCRRRNMPVGMEQYSRQPKIKD